MVVKKLMVDIGTRVLLRKDLKELHSESSSRENFGKFLKTPRMVEIR
jgi:hypothetical protein